DLERRQDPARAVPGLLGIGGPAAHRRPPARVQGDPDLLQRGRRPLDRPAPGGPAGARAPGAGAYPHPRGRQQHGRGGRAGRGAGRQRRRDWQQHGQRHGHDRARARRGRPRRRAARAGRRRDGLAARPPGPPAVTHARWPGWARLAAVAVLALAAVIAVAPAALAATTGDGAAAVIAHASLTSTQPADGSVLRTAPSQVSASFDESVGISADSLVVYSPGGQRVDDGTARHAGASEVAVGLRAGLGDGTYTAVWHVIS